MTAPAAIPAEVFTDPVLFVQGMLRHELWAIPKQILRAIARPHAKVAVKACHSSGKTFTAAQALLWFITRYPRSTIVSTAPTGTQVKELLWKEVHLAMQGSRIDFPKALQTELRLVDGSVALGRSTNMGVRFQGFHGTVLIIIDEAPGVDDEIWDAID